MRLVASRQIQDLDELRQHFRLAKVTLVAHSHEPLLVVHGEMEAIPMDMVEAWATRMPHATLLV